MSEFKSKLHLVCGKIASGKSTLSQKLATSPNTIVLSEDTWLAMLFPEEIVTVGDYVRYAGRLRDVIGPHIIELLYNGVTVVLDFPANTHETRTWMRNLIDESGAEHTLHFLDVPDEKCRARLRERNEGGKHEFDVTDEQFDQITRHFSEPTLEEGFNVVIYKK